MEPLVSVAVMSDGEVRGIPGPGFGPQHFPLLGEMMAAAMGAEPPE